VVVSTFTVFAKTVMLLPLFEIVAHGNKQKLAFEHAIRLVDLAVVLVKNVLMTEKRE
jgi:hypothetical protein